METGGVIVAAGMSTRMEQFKQLMKIGNLTMAERVIVNFQRAGIREIVMVTGHRCQQLEKELRGFHITFLKNEAYETTEMFDSAKIGLQYFMGRCSRVLFCPVDIPFFQEKTVKALLACQGDVVRPTYNGRGGHPILLNTSLIPEILKYQGQKGLKGALSSIPDLNFRNVPVEDEGAVMDADTQEDFRRLVDLHTSRMMRGEVTVGLVSQKPFFDSQTALLLTRIQELRSVREACVSLGISYSKGFRIIHTAEDGIGYRIVERTPGGKHGGTATVTPQGRCLMEQFYTYQQKMQEAAETIFQEVFQQKRS